MFYQFQLWRLLTNFLFLGPFSFNFAIRVLMIARYGVQLEKALISICEHSLLYTVLSAIPFFWSPFLGVSLVFMLIYVWSREFPTANVNIYGLVTLKAVYLPWAMLGLDVIFGSPIMPDLLGIITGHMYYFLTVLHPLATGKKWLDTPRWLNRQVARWRIGAPAAHTTTQPERPFGNAAFRGREYRLSDRRFCVVHPSKTGTDIAFYEIPLNHVNSMWFFHVFFCWIISRICHRGLNFCNNLLKLKDSGMDEKGN